MSFWLLVTYWYGYQHPVEIIDGSNDRLGITPTVGLAV
jgi:hypothetical protein